MIRIFTLDVIPAIEPESRKNKGVIPDFSRTNLLDSCFRRNDTWVGFTIQGNF